MGIAAALRRLMPRRIRAAAVLAMAILPAAAPPPPNATAACRRACLEAVMTRYLAGLAAHDPARAALAPNARLTENAALTKPGDGVWRSFKALRSYRMTFADPSTQQVAFLGNAVTDEGSTMIAIRLHVRDGRIDEVETILPGSAAGGTFDLSSGAGSLKTARPAFARALLPAERRDRSQMIQAADLHYEGIERGNGDIVPFGDRCIKIENGVQLIHNPDFKGQQVSPYGVLLPNFQAMGCTEQFNTGVWKTDTITARRYPLVDEERGVGVAFGVYNQFATAPCAETPRYGLVCPGVPVDPFSLVMVEAFKIRAGLIEEVESIFTVLDHLDTSGRW